MFQLPPKLEIYQSNCFGRGIRAKHDIQFGEIIFKEDPIFNLSSSAAFRGKQNLIDIEEVLEDMLSEDEKKVLYYQSYFYPCQQPKLATTKL